MVVQNDVFKQSAIGTSVVCLFTSNLTLANAPGNVLLKRGEARLPKISVVNVSEILTVDKEELTEPIGKLSADRSPSCSGRFAYTSAVSLPAVVLDRLKAKP